MSNEKQIEEKAVEEMAKVIEITEQIARDAVGALPSPRMYAKDLYWKGYRKQSENVIELPCKVGDIVYAISESRIEECRCDEICIYGNDNIVMTEHNCDYDCKGCPFSSWGQDYSGEHSCQGEYGVYCFNFEDFGKTVFLTKEEAEAKMKGGAE